jgi:hypothetical protein
VVVVVGKGVLGRPTTFGEVWSEVRGRLGALVGLALLTALLVVAPMLVGVVLAAVLSAAGSAGAVLGVLLAIGGVAAGAYLYVRLALAAPVLLLEKASVRTSLSRSGVLVSRSWWRVCGLLLLAMLITRIVASVLGVPVQLVGSVLTGSDASGRTAAFVFVAEVVASGIAATLVAPFSAGVRALLYVDRRMRAEGLDLTLQAAAAPGAAPA